MVSVRQGLERAHNAFCVRKNFGLPTSIPIASTTAPHLSNQSSYLQYSYPPTAIAEQIRLKPVFISSRLHDVTFKKK